MESLAPTLSSLHPLTIVNHIHSACVKEVKSKNILKGEPHQHSWNESIKMAKSQAEIDRNFTETTIHEGTRLHRIQGAFTIPKVHSLPIN